MRAALWIGAWVGCTVPAPTPVFVEDVELTDTSSVALVDVPNPVVVGIMPVFHPDEMVQRFSPLASYLGGAIDSTIELRLSESYEDMIELVRSGKVDLAQLSPFAYVRAKKLAPDIQLIATNIAEGSSTYSGYIVARTEGGIRSPEDLRGVRFGFVSETSASGYLYPAAFLSSEGIDPKSDFKEIVMTGRHDVLLTHLISGRIDAGGTFSGALLHAERIGLDMEKIEIVAKTGRIPYDAWVTRGGLHPSVARQVTRSLLALSTRTRIGRRILRPLRSINAFAPAKDSDYDGVRRIEARMVVVE